MNSFKSQRNAWCVLLISMVSLILAGCAAENQTGNPAGAPATASDEVGLTGEDDVFAQSLSKISGETSGGEQKFNRTSRSSRRDIVTALSERAEVRVRTTYEFMPREELWVIAQGLTAPAQPAEERPGCGALMAKLPDVEKKCLCL